MLSLNVKDGEYITIGENIVVQAYRFGTQTQVLVDAPRDIPILRGKLRERCGGAKPDSLIPAQPSPRSDAYRSAKEARDEAYRAKKENAKAALDEIRAMLSTLGGTPESAWLSRRLDQIAPLVE